MPRRSSIGAAAAIAARAVAASRARMRVEVVVGVVDGAVGVGDDDVHPQVGRDRATDRSRRRRPARR